MLEGSPNAEHADAEHADADHADDADPLDPAAVRRRARQSVLGAAAITAIVGVVGALLVEEPGVWLLAMALAFAYLVGRTALSMYGELGRISLTALFFLRIALFAVPILVIWALTRI